MKTNTKQIRLDGHQILAISLLSGLVACYLGLLFGWGFFFTFFVGFSTVVVAWFVLGVLFFDHSSEYLTASHQMAFYETCSFDDREIDEIYTSRFLNRNLFVATYRNKAFRPVFYLFLWGGYAVFAIYLLATGRSFSEMIFLFSLFLFTWLLATLRMKSCFYPILRKFQVLVESPNKKEGESVSDVDRVSSNDHVKTADHSN